MEIVHATSSEFSRAYELTRLLQSYQDAGYHEIYEARNRNTGSEVCVKIINGVDFADARRSHDSINRRVDHPGLVEVIDSIETDSLMQLVFKRFKFGTLKEQMFKNSGFTMP